MSEEFGDAFGDEEAQSASSGHSHAESEAELVYSSAVEFFAELLAQSYVREVNEGATFAWCPEWYKHPEALIRMEAIWRAWEHLRLEPALGVSTWWLNHADPHMRILMDTEGPFKKCAYDGHKPLAAEKAALPHVIPEAGIFD
ncbi:DUF4913 domain-containing protein [Pseudarthrobacter sp. NIBRBAC000502770]|uniref:DUF4913 domain-containing protein n=1 Tax=Pseudarthrobacter sp. NIBRBAC000502770 TaxID=2590785 RepID=UPI00113FE7B7|nr:DUF4913 domain-containing protein [Pseudarthrobacter sp. NIBRBAC000502770]QDG87103.1 DUF4913 domain-containing protein [Pseudarthrobacter sp. NIBRBAC000502770]